MSSDQFLSQMHDFYREGIQPKTKQEDEDPDAIAEMLREESEDE